MIKLLLFSRWETQACVVHTKRKDYSVRSSGRIKPVSKRILIIGFLSLKTCLYATFSLNVKRVEKQKPDFSSNLIALIFAEDVRQTCSMPKTQL